MSIYSGEYKARQRMLGLDSTINNLHRNVDRTTLTKRILKGKAPQPVERLEQRKHVFGAVTEYMNRFYIENGYPTHKNIYIINS